MEPFIGEIRYFPYNFAPKGWAQCNGASLGMQQYVALYSLIGQQFGGSGTNFNLPDLRGRVPLGMGRRSIDNLNFTEAQQLGTETVALTSTQVPPHIHGLNASSITPANNADNKAPTGNLTGHAATGTFPPPIAGGVAVTGLYNGAATATTPVTMHTSTVVMAGGSAGHQNCAPSLVLMPCIAILGLYPPRQ